MSDWQRRNGARVPQRSNYGMPNAQRTEHYRNANGPDRPLTARQEKRIALKRGAEQKRNARRTWRRKR